MFNYELKAHLRNLVLSPEDGELGWLGTEAQWGLTRAEIAEYES